MQQDERQTRLSRISTIWTLVADAHCPPDEEVASAQSELMQRYHHAAYRYLLGAVRDEDVADELFQQFALRLVQQAFKSADHRRGRFRDYVKTALINLVRDHRRNENKRRPSVLLEESVAIEAPSEQDDPFLDSWRREILARTWDALRDESKQGAQPFYHVLKHRAENSGISSREMARGLTQTLSPARPFTETGIRKTLQRARQRFARLLLDEVAHSLERPTIEELERELVELHLLPYCRTELRERFGAQ